MPWISTQPLDASAGALHPGTHKVGGDRAEWATAAVLHERYLKDVYRYVLRRVPQREEAEDITAQVFAAAFASLPRFRGQCSPYLWLLGIARRKIADSLRRRASRRETLASELADEAAAADPIWEALAAVEGPEAAIMRSEARRMLAELVAGLIPDQREALMLQSVEQLSAADIGVVMGRSTASVYSLLKRARATLYERGRGYFLGEDAEQIR